MSAEDGGAHPVPSLERATERTHLGVAEHERHLLDGDPGVAQVASGEIAPERVQDCLVRCVFFTQAPGEGALAHVQQRGHLRRGGRAGGELPQNDVAHLLGQGYERRSLGKQVIRVPVQDGQEVGIRGRQAHSQDIGVQEDPVAIRREPHGSPEDALVLGRIRRLGVHEANLDGQQVLSREPPGDEDEVRHDVFHHGGRAPDAKAHSLPHEDAVALVLDERLGGIGEQSAVATELSQRIAQRRAAEGEVVEDSERAWPVTLREVQAEG